MKIDKKAERIQIIFNDIEDLLGEIEERLFRLEEHGYNTNGVVKYIEKAYIQLKKTESGKSR